MVAQGATTIPDATNIPLLATVKSTTEAPWIYLLKLLPEEEKQDLTKIWVSTCAKLISLTLLSETPVYSLMMKHRGEFSFSFGENSDEEHFYMNEVQKHCF